MHIIIYTAKRANPHFIRLGATWLWLICLLTSGAGAAGAWYGSKAGRFANSLALAQAQVSLAQKSLAAAEKAEAGARAQLAGPGPGGTLGFLRRLENIPLSGPPDTVSVGRQPAGRRFAVQVSSFRRRGDAESQAAVLRKLVPRSVAIGTVEMGDNLWYRVLIDDFPSEQSARAWADSLTAAGTIREYIIQEFGPHGG